MTSIRNSIWYHFAAYTTYIGLILEFITYKMYAGTRLAILGMAITFVLYFGTIIIGGIFLVLAGKGNNTSPIQTNIIHDIGVVIYFGHSLLLIIAILGEGFMQSLNI